MRMNRRKVPTELRSEQLSGLQGEIGKFQGIMNPLLINPLQDLRRRKLGKLIVNCPDLPLLFC